MAQALVRFLARSARARDGREQPFFGGVFGIFGHGNVAGIGQALQRAPRRAALLPAAQRAGDGAHRGGVREDAQPPAHAGVHVVDRARRDQHDHRRGGATINRLPVLLLPGDIFATRRPAPVLQQLESTHIAGRVGQRLLQAGLALLGPHQPARAAPHGAARGDARADLAGRNRRRHACAAAGRAGRGLRLSGGVLRAAGLDDSARRGRIATLLQRGRATDPREPTRR